jgi:hypothetical protein
MYCLIDSQKEKILSTLITTTTVLKGIPEWVWKWTFGLFSLGWKKLFGAKIEWEIWDAPTYDIKGYIQSAVIFRLLNRTTKEIQNLSLEIELVMGNTHEVVIHILPLWVQANTRHMEKIEFTETPQIRKPNRKAIQFDLPPAKDVRIELLFPFSVGFPLHLLKHYNFSHKKVKIKQLQRFQKD